MISNSTVCVYDLINVHVTVDTALTLMVAKVYKYIFIDHYIHCMYVCIYSETNNIMMLFDDIIWEKKLPKTLFQ